MVSLSVGTGMGLMEEHNQSKHLHFRELMRFRLRSPEMSVHYRAQVQNYTIFAPNRPLVKLTELDANLTPNMR